MNLAASSLTQLPLPGLGNGWAHVGVFSREEETTLSRCDHVRAAALAGVAASAAPAHVLAERAKLSTDSSSTCCRGAGGASGAARHQLVGTGGRALSGRRVCRLREDKPAAW